MFVALGVMNVAWMAVVAVLVAAQKLLPPRASIDVPLALAIVGARPDRCPSRKENPMTHTTGTREEWLAARLELLEAEKELTRRSDEVARQRQALPWVPVEKDYRFETEDGQRVARRPVRRPLAAADLPLHVRPGLHRRLPVLLGDRRRLQRVGRAPRSTTTSR